MVPENVAEAISGLLSRAAEHVAQKLTDGDVADEPDFSGQFCGAASAMFDVRSEMVPGVRLSARQLTSRGSGSEEKRYGADIVIALHYDLPGYKISKGLLVQAKIKSSATSAEELFDEIIYDGKLSDQCRDMLAHSSSPFVFIYAPGYVAVYPAAQIIASGTRPLDGGGTYAINIFFYDFAICWVGDLNIKATDRESLKQALEAFNARHGLLVEASSRDSPRSREKIRSK